MAPNNNVLNMKVNLQACIAMDFRKQGCYKHDVQCCINL